MCTCLPVQVPAAVICAQHAFSVRRQDRLRHVKLTPCKALHRLSTVTNITYKQSCLTQPSKSVGRGCTPAVSGSPGLVTDKAWSDTLVVVEGLSDQLAVRKAVPAQVFVLHGASKSSFSATSKLLQQRASTCKQVIALLDPDVAGRQSRTVLDACLSGQCLHAFIPVWQATASRDIRRKSAGDVGVEHADASQIRQALSNARPSCPGRKEFCRADLVEWGLLVEMGTSLSSQAGCVSRRAAVSAALGLGNCDGKQLLRQLNRYNFSRQDVAFVLKTACTQPGTTDEAVHVLSRQTPTTAT